MTAGIRGLKRVFRRQGEASFLVIEEMKKDPREAGLFVANTLLRPLLLRTLGLSRLRCRS
jgi:hypothetical protein